MTDETHTPVHLTQSDVAEFAASIGKTVADLTHEDFEALTAQHGGSIIIEQPVPTIGDLEAEHLAYVPPDSVPVEVPMLAFKLALRQIGVYGEVKAGAEVDDLSEIYWSSAKNVVRKNKFTIKMALGLGWGPTRLDEIFVLANSINQES